VDAIVNAANTLMRGGGGVDGAIHAAAGRGLLAELEQVAPDGAATGSVVVTGGHRLRQRHVLHTPGPVWHGGARGEPAQLASCYRECCAAAEKLRLESVAFCSISTGVYGYPLEPAAAIALDSVLGWLAAHPDTSLRRVVFAMFAAREHEVFAHALAARG
jgi:O-acetyl-ADP-ribose deacetylase (regulator of RNase III)